MKPVLKRKLSVTVGQEFNLVGRFEMPRILGMITSVKFVIVSSLRFKVWVDGREQKHMPKYDLSRNRGMWDSTPMSIEEILCYDARIEDWDKARAREEWKAKVDAHYATFSKGESSCTVSKDMYGNKE